MNIMIKELFANPQLYGEYIKKLEKEIMYDLILIILIAVVVLASVAVLVLTVRFFILRSYRRTEYFQEEIKDVKRLYESYIKTKTAEQIVTRKLNSLQQFRNFNFEKFLIALLDEQETFHSSLVNLIEERNKITDEFKRLDRKTEAHLAPHVKESLVRYTEKYLANLFSKFDNLSKNSYLVLVKASYTSPKGRNHYAKKYIMKESDFFAIEDKRHKRSKYQQTKEYQRNLMTPGLRYDVLKRDGYSCKICGAKADQGAHLHVDHIKPVAKGGKTIMENLQTLCDLCNLGKSDKF